MNKRQRKKALKTAICKICQRYLDISFGIYSSFLQLEPLDDIAMPKGIIMFPDALVSR